MAKEAKLRTIERTLQLTKAFQSEAVSSSVRLKTRVGKT